MICRDEGPFDVVVPNLTWVAVGAFYKFQGSPTGYYLGLTSLDTVTASQQKCEPCGKDET